MCCLRGIKNQSGRHCGLREPRRYQHERALMSLICTFPQCRQPFVKTAIPQGRLETANSQRAVSKSEQFQTCESPPLMKRCHRSPSCHLLLVGSFIKMSATGGWKRNAEAHLDVVRCPSEYGVSVCIQAPAAAHHPVITSCVMRTARRRASEHWSAR